MRRQDYNFFEQSGGFGTARVDVKVVSNAGSAVVVKNVPVTAGAVVTGPSNF